MTKATSLLNGVPSNQAFGWYYDFPQSTTKTKTGTARVIKYLKGNAGSMLVLADEPGGDACNPEMVTTAYGFDIATGKTFLADKAGGIPVESIGGTQNFVAIDFVRKDNKPGVVVTCATGCQSPIAGGNGSTSGGGNGGNNGADYGFVPTISGGNTPKFVNWRAVGD